MKTLLATIAIALTALLIGSAPAGADPGDPLTPLKVNVVSFDGKQRFKVAKNLRFVTSCSKDCNAIVRVRLVTPVTTYRFKSDTSIPATGTWTLKLKTSKFTRSYIRKNIRRSRLEVTFVATDLESGRKSTKIRVFGFRK